MSINTARRTGHDHPVPAIAGTASPSLRVVRPSAIQTQMHPHVYRIALGFWVVFLGIFWATFWVSAHALFMVVISSFYAVMFFGVPYVMLRQTPERMKGNKSILTFLKQPFATIDGPISGHEALLQVIMVPACLILGGTAIGFIIHSARSIY